MNTVAFIFKQAPHGKSSGREGLEALLATAALSEEIGVFFLGDGVLHLVPAQQPDIVFAKDYISTLKLLELYDIEAVYVCEQSLNDRGLNSVEQWSIPAESVNANVMQQQLSHYDKVLTF